MHNKLSLNERFICVLFVVSLVFSSRSLELLNIPLYYFLEIGALGLVFVFLFLTVCVNKERYRSVGYDILFVAIIIVSMDVICSLMSYINYGQGIIISLLTFRVAFITCAIIFLFAIIFRVKQITEHSEFFDYLVTLIFYLSLFITLLWVYLTYTLNAEEYYLTSGNLLVDTRSDGSYRFRFDIFFPFMLLCCGWLRLKTTNKKLINLGAMCFSIIYIVFYYQGRMFILAMIIAMGLSMIRPAVYRLRYVLILVLAFITTAAFLIIYFTYDQLINLYQTLLNDFNLSDSSSLTRLKIFRMMGDNFLNNFIMGNGYLSNQGDASFSNVKFSPLDVGLLGVVYTYGFIIFIIGFVWFSHLWLKSFGKNNSQIFTFLFTTLFINSIFTGGLFFRPYQILVMMVFVYLFGKTRFLSIYKEKG